MICVGHLGDQVIEQIGIERFGVRLRYSHDGPRPLGTLGAIRKAAPFLGERFLVLYGDTYLRLDYGGAAAAWQHSGLPAMMTVLHNNGRWERSNACFTGTLVTAYDKRSPTAEMEWIDYGLGGLSREALTLTDSGDLADLYGALARRAQLFGFEALERFYEIGTPEGLEQTKAFLAGEGGKAAPAT